MTRSYFMPLGFVLLCSFNICPSIDSLDGAVEYLARQKKHTPALVSAEKVEIPLDGGG